MALPISDVLFSRINLIRLFIFMAAGLPVVIAATMIFLLLSKIDAPDISYAGDKKNYDTVTISFVGDLMCHSPLFQYAETDSGGYDFSPYFEYISGELSAADLTIGNLETVTAGNTAKFTGYPDFNTPEQYLDALKGAGFDFLVTANNHSLDRGESGIYKTIENIRARDIGYTGTFLSKGDRDSIRIVKVKGAAFAVLSYTYGTNGKPVPKGREHIINRIEPELITNDIQAAKGLGANIVIVFYHFGEEYKKLPNAYQKRAVQTALDAGAEIVIGSHPHVLQPAEWPQKDSIFRAAQFVAYSLGNFLSNQQWRYSDAGAILTLSFLSAADSQKVFPLSASFLPTWVFKGRIDGAMTYRILAANKFNCTEDFPFLGKREFGLMKQAYLDSKQILTGFSSQNIFIPEPDCTE